MIMAENKKNWRGELNEYIQRENLKGVIKDEYDKLGSDQHSEFICKLTFNNFQCSGEGRTKKAALQEASKIMIKLLDDEKGDFKTISPQSLYEDSTPSSNFYAMSTKKVLDEFEKMEMVEKVKIEGITYYKIVE